MANALNTIPAAPPMAQQEAQPQNGGALPGNALQMPGAMTPQAVGSPRAQGGQPQQPPQITHKQAVCAMRHFHAITQELEGLLADPNLGKSDVKSKIIDGTVKLVSQRIISAAEAVAELGGVPSDPILQRKWVTQHFHNTMIAQNAILEQARASEPGTMDWAVEGQHTADHPDAHMDTMKSLRGLFQG